MKTVSASLNPIEDKELWLVEGDGYCLPVYATLNEVEGNPDARFFIVEPMDGYTPDQLGALAAKLADGNRSTHSEIFLLERNFLYMRARKAPGVTPSYYFLWHGERKQELGAKPATDEDGEVTDEMESFLRAWHKTTMVASPAQLRIIWVSLNRFLLKFLVEERKPVKFFFFRLAPFPYRTNWKHILCRWHEKTLPCLLWPEERRNIAMVETNMEAHLRSTKLFALDKNHRFFHWQLEAIPSKMWREATIEAERRRQQIKGCSEYADYLLNMVNRLRPAIVESLVAHVKGMAEIAARLGDSGTTGRPRLLPDHGNKRIRSRPDLDFDPSVFDRPKDQPLLGDNSAPPIDVPVVSDIPCKASDVRDTGGDVQIAGGGS